MSVNPTFKKSCELAIKNITSHGDTDIFPYPFENHAFFDKKTEIIDLLVDYNRNFDDYITRYPPSNVSSLTPVSYSGFRWATQIDPLWNAYFLSLVLNVTDKIEATRIAKEKNIVFSYRYKPNFESGDLFDRDVGWYQFMIESRRLSEQFSYVVVCDISEFYARLGHHRLENALKQVTGGTDHPKKIMNFLQNYSNTNSFGLPIGGPASRILSELTINQIDRILISQGFTFTRFADDYHVFANSIEEAYQRLIFLSEKLFTNQGLALQKSKTRIMTSNEFIATNPLRDDSEEIAPEVAGEAAVASHRRSQLLRFSLRFDPYSPTAESDYEKLKEEVRNFDIVNLLKQELNKSRIHVALTRKIITAIRFLEGETKDQAVLSMLDNSEVLYPIFSSVLIMIESVYEELNENTKAMVIEKIMNLIKSESHIFRVDVHLGFAVRILSHFNSPETQLLLQGVFTNSSGASIRRDIILIMSRWGEWYWLSDLRNSYRNLSALERRAFIVASYSLKDEGRHWRDHLKSEFSPFEKFIQGWASTKAGVPNWSAPL